MLFAGAALTLALMTAAQTAAPAPIPAGRRYGLDRPAVVEFEVSTNAGVYKGTVLLTRLDARGLDGLGRLDLRGTLDTDSISVGEAGSTEHRVKDSVLSAHLARWVLRSSEGDLVFGATRRLPPLAKAGEGNSPEDELFAAGVYLDGRRGGKYLEMRYRFRADPTGANVQLSVQLPLADLGLPPPKHPFIEVKGPVTLRLNARLARR